MKIKIVYNDRSSETVNAVDSEWKDYFLVIHLKGKDVVIPWLSIKRIEEEE